MNDKKRESFGTKGFAISAAILLGTFGGVANAANWFGGVSSGVVSTEDVGVVDENVDENGAESVDENGAQNSLASLYAEGEEKALSAFQEGMISVQEFANASLAVLETPRGRQTQGLIADAEWLNWRAASTNALYSQAYQSTGYLEENRAALNPKGNGVRARLGTRFSDGWDLAFVYTYFEGSDGGRQRLPASGTATTGTNLTSSIIALPLTDSALVDVGLNVFDLEFGRWLQCGDSFRWRPFGGVRAAKIYEIVRGTYDPASQVGGYWDIYQSTKETGYGLRAGGTAYWDFNDQWSVFGGGALSVLATTCESRAQETYSTGAGTLLDYRGHSILGTPVLEARAGVSWKCGGWEFKGGYELSDWFNTTTLGTTDGDILFYGYFAGASWNF